MSPKKKGKEEKSKLKAIENGKMKDADILSKEEEEKRKAKEKFWAEKKYIAQVKRIDIRVGENIIVLNEAEALENEIYSGYRVIIKHRDDELICIVDLSSEMVKKGEVGCFKDVWEVLRLKGGDIIKIGHMERPASIGFIKKKLDGETLSPIQISTIISDLMENRLSKAELASWISSMYIRGMSEEEVVALTESIVKSGAQLDLGVKPVADKHCIGGVAGNRTTMVVVPILAAAGVYIPKTSSRAITSAAGTADTMEVLAPVKFTVGELRRMVRKAKGAIAWGGGMNLAAADDKLIRIRHPLSLDPRGVLLASILAKKRSVGSKFLVIDIPIGRGTKVENMEAANALGTDFIKIGKRLGMRVESLITDGSEPVGNGIGAALECKDVMEVLQGGGPGDLSNKSCLIAGRLLEMVGKVSEGDGYQVAQHFLENGKAWAKMQEIIDIQGGNPKVKVDDLPIGGYKHTVESTRDGKISHIDNKAISKIARAAGAPRDTGAGVYLFRLKGDRVRKGDVLFDIYSSSETRLDFAIKALGVWDPIEMEKILLGTLR